MNSAGKLPGPWAGRRTRLRNANRRVAGYTLLELLVVMGILAVLTAMATPQLMGYFGKAKMQSAQVQIQNIGTALELYYLDNGTYPSVSAGLKALVEPPSELAALERAVSEESEDAPRSVGQRLSVRVSGRQR